MAELMEGRPPRMPHWHARCDLHDWPTCVGWCPGCAEDHRAGKHTCQAGIWIRLQEEHEHNIPEHPHACAWCYPLPAHDRPPVKALSHYQSWPRSLANLAELLAEREGQPDGDGAETKPPF